MTSPTPSAPPTDSATPGAPSSSGPSAPSTPSSEPSGDRAYPTTDPAPTATPPASSPSPYVAGGTGYGGLGIDFSQAAEMSLKFRQLSGEGDDVRTHSVRGVARAAGSAGFPGLAEAVAAFGDVANEKLSVVVGNIGAMSGRVDQFTQHMRAVDKALRNANKPYGY